MPKAEREAKVDEVTQILGLSEWSDRKPGQLSGGQRQRVAMGRAIVREPAVFLMDEPLSNLDAQLRVQMRAEVCRIQQRLATTTIYVTHDQIEAMTMGDRVAVMRAGSVLQCDSPQNVYERPVNLFVAAFIGSPAMNLYEAVLGDGAQSLTLGTQAIRLAPDVTAAHPRLPSYIGRKIVVGLRPEHLSSPDDTTLPTLEGDVDLVEALGSELLVHFSTDAQRVTPDGVADYGDDQISGRGPGVARIPPRAKPRVGEKVRFAVDIQKMHFFDAETGHAI